MLKPAQVYFLAAALLLALCLMAATLWVAATKDRTAPKAPRSGILAFSLQPSAFPPK